MADASKLFRKVALDRLSSPEQLDMMTTVTTPYGWLSLATFGIIIAVAIIWGFLGSIPVKVKGQGMLMRQGGISRVVSLGPGQLSEIFVSINDSVNRGQVVARMSDPIKLAELQNMRARLEELESQNGEIVKNLKNRTRFLKKRLADQEELLKKGLIIPAKVETTRGELNDAALTMSKSVYETNALKREVEIKEEKLNIDSRVVSAVSGRVIEIKVSVGSVIGGGTTIINLENTEKKLEAIIYVPISEGKKVKAGMEIDVTPSTVKKEESGSLLGLVTSVSEYPVTYEGMMSILDNEQLARLLSRDTPYAVQVDFIPDIRKEGEYRWSTGKVSSVAIKSGTLCLGEIIVEQKRPISFIMPYITSRLGL
jgi:HlyD family secretion protein